MTAPATYKRAINSLLLIASSLLLQQRCTAFEFSFRRPWRRNKPKTQTSDPTNFQDLLLTRRTVNDFEPVLPERWETDLRDAILAATYAPNHKRTEPWRFHLLGPESIQRVCELNAQLVAAKKGEEAGDKKLKRWLAMPGWLVVTCRKQTDDNDNASMLNPMSLAREDYAACCCAVQNLCLSLHARGIGTKWTTGPVNFEDKFADAVGFASDEEYVVGTVWFGKAVSKQPMKAPPKKLAVDDVLVRHE